MEFSKPEVYAVIAALVTVIGVLWGIIVMWMKHNAERLRRYETRQDESHIEITRLTGEMHYLKGQIRGISDLSQSVLDEIRKLKIKDLQDDRT